MKLYNRTKVPDKVLQEVLQHAARLVGARSKSVVVMVRSSRWCHGMAWRGMPYEWFLRGERWHKEHGRGELIDTDCGWFEIWLPKDFYSDPLVLAESFFKVAAHEWRHIRDYQKGGVFTRKRRWASRPQEKRAIRSASRAMADMSKRRGAADAIIDLGIEIEKLRKGKV